MQLPTISLISKPAVLQYGLCISILLDYSTTIEDEHLGPLIHIKHPQPPSVPKNRLRTSHAITFSLERGGGVVYKDLFSK